MPGRPFEHPDDARSPRVCYCMHVHEATLRRAIRAGLRDVRALRDATAASSGCGTCRFDLEELIRVEAARAARGGPT
jgi:NAD(P)H-nitrite reductase large subunit